MQGVNGGKPTNSGRDSFSYNTLKHHFKAGDITGVKIRLYELEEYISNL